MDVGERIGDYEIIQTIGSGGMGTVYKVKNIVSDRTEAIKVLLPGFVEHAELLERFLREIKVHASLDHPNIARMYTAQRIGSDLIMAMEFIDGESFEKLLARGPLGVKPSVNCASQVLAALEYAHSRRVVHRDVKPANIMVTPIGAVKLMDFGIARMQSDRRMTRTGQVLGSLFYMSPEQIRGSEPDARSDIYSLGITLYEFVTGTRPFEGDSDYSIMSAHLGETPRAPIEIIPGIPNYLNDTILRAIAKDPAERFQSAAIFMAALESPGTSASQVFVRASGGTQILPQTLAAPAPASPPPSSRGAYMVLGSIATVAVMVAAAVVVPKAMHSSANPLEPQNTPSVEKSGPSIVDREVTERQPSEQLVDPHKESSLRQQPSLNSVAVPRGTAPSLGQASLVTEPQGAAQPASAIQGVPAPLVPPAISPVQVVPRELRDRITSLHGRAAAVDVSLDAVARQLSAQGLGLRSSLVVAQTTVHENLSLADAEVSAGKYADARESLDSAEAALREIERVYGR